MRVKLLQYGLSNAHYIICNENNTSPSIIQLQDNGHAHIICFQNYKTDEEMKKAFMDFVGNSIYTEDFDDTDEDGIGKEFYMEANRTFPLIASRFNINITLYNLDGITTSYFYHHNDHINVLQNNGLCKPVANSCVLVLQANHFQTVIQARNLPQQIEI